MKFNIVEKKDNPLLKRKELVVEIEFDASTPQKKDIIARLCTEEGAKEDCVVIDSFKQKYGTKMGTAYLKIYESKESKEKIEKAPKKKGEKSEKKPAEEANAEKPEGKEEAKGEEKKEEVPKEEKKEEVKEAPKKEEAPKEEKKERPKEGEQ